MLTTLEGSAMRAIAFAIFTVGAITISSFGATASPAQTATQLNPTYKVMLNPQPLPPKQSPVSTRLTAGSTVMLNPQPLPPKQSPVSTRVTAGSTVMLNPQPLPPKQSPVSTR